MERKKLILAGSSGCGKDYLLKQLIKKGMKYIPKITTRPKRAEETLGIEYIFTDNFNFKSLLDSEKIKVSQKFYINNEKIINETWYYGITIDNFNTNEVFIMTPYEINQLSEEDLNNVFIIYLDIASDIRKERIKERFDSNDSIERRLKADEKDFGGFDKFNMKITDPYFNTDLLFDEIMKVL